MKKDKAEKPRLWPYIAAAIFIIIVIAKVEAVLNYKEALEFVCTRWDDKPEFKNQSCIVNYISEFQTLITGVAALLAAFWTINEMRKTEKKQHQRHHQIMTHSIQDEFTALDRLVKTYAVTLNDAYKSLSNFKRRCPEQPNERDVYILQECCSINDAFKIIDTFFKSTAYKHADKYFNGALAFELTALREELQPGLRPAQRADEFDTIFSKDVEKDHFNNWFYGHDIDSGYGAQFIWSTIDGCLPHLTEILFEFIRIESRLEALAKTFPELKTL